MNAVQPARCLLELRADELEKTRNVCGEHGTTRLAVATQPAQVSRPPGDVCIKLNTSERIPIISAVVSGESNWRGQILRTLVCVHERALEAFGPHPAEARLSIRRNCSVSPSGRMIVRPCLISRLIASSADFAPCRHRRIMFETRAEYDIILV
jgi:hypothetical protein